MGKKRKRSRSRGHIERWKGVGKVRVRRRRDGTIIDWHKVKGR